MPECRVGQHELHSHVRMIALAAVNVHDNTLQRTLCLDVRHSEPLSSVHLRGDENQPTVSTDGPRESLIGRCRARAKWEPKNIGTESLWPGRKSRVVPPGESEKNVLVPRLFLLFSLLDVP